MTATKSDNFRSCHKLISIVFVIGQQKIGGFGCATCFAINCFEIQWKTDTVAQHIRTNEPQN